MKKTIKRIMALMLSLVMVLGCIPSFINEVDAFKIEPDAEPANYQVELYYGGVKVTEVPLGTQYWNISYKLIRDDGNETLTGNCTLGGLDEVGRKYVYGEVNTGTHRRANSTILDSFGNAMVDGSGSPGTYRTKTYFNQVTEEVLYCTLQLYFPIDVIGPKTPITSVSLEGTGYLEEGKASSEQTLIWSEPDGGNFSSDDAYGATWYNANTCLSGDEASTFNKGDTYYKKVTLTPASGYEFDTDNITSIQVTNGTFVDFISKSASQIEAIISAEAIGKIVSVNYTKPTSFTELVSLYNNRLTDIDIVGASLGDAAYKSTYYDYISATTSADANLLGYYTFKTTLTFADETERNSVENILFRNNILDSSLKASTVDLALASLLNNDVSYTYPINDNKIIIYEKFDFGKTTSLSGTLNAGMTVDDVKASIQLKEGQSWDAIRIDKPDYSSLENGEKLEGGKTYTLFMHIKEDDAQAYTSIKFNDDTLDERSLHDGPQDKYYDIVTSMDGYVTVIYKFDCQNQSGGGHRKKKTEEPKPEEPTKTPEEILKEELLKDDVKKANSNEGEKINPQAKYIKGYDDGLFRSERKVNNIELMSMVTELFENVDVKETKDLNQGKDYWGQEIIDKANALGLIPGNKDDKNYNVTSEVSRGDLAVVIYNLIKDYTTSPSLSTRNNCKDAIGKDYETAVTKLVDLGILKGYDDGMFHGDYTLTRAEAVVVINRALKSLGFEINMPNITLSFPDLSKEHWAYAEIMYAANK